MAPTRDELIMEISELHKQHDGKPDYLQLICRSLNERGITTLNGAGWKAPNLLRFIRTHRISVSPIEQVEQLIRDEMPDEFRRVRAIKGEELKSVLRAARWLSEVAAIAPSLDDDDSYQVVPVVLSRGLLEAVAEKMRRWSVRPTLSMILNDKLVEWIDDA